MKYEELYFAQKDRNANFKTSQLCVYGLSRCHIRNPRQIPFRMVYRSPTSEHFDFKEGAAVV